MSPVPKKTLMTLPDPAACADGQMWLVETPKGLQHPMGVAYSANAREVEGRNERMKNACKKNVLKRDDDDKRDCTYATVPIAFRVAVSAVWMSFWSSGGELQGRGTLSSLGLVCL